MPPRRFLIDAINVQRGGVFTHLVNVVPELAKQAPRDRFRVVVADERVANSLPDARNVEIDFRRGLGLRQRVEYTYRQAGAAAAAWGADLYYAVSERAPLNAPCPTIASFRNPNVFNWRSGQKLTLRQHARLWALYGMARASAARCERTLFVSEDSARWIGDSIRLPEHRRAVVHHGIDHERWVRKQRREGPGSYILSVSSVYPYKNYVRLIEAFAQLYERRPDVPDLVIIGDEQDAAYGARMAAAREAAGEARQAIHILGEVPYADILRYYREAALFVFPSHLETFGHPLLEAMASELPLVAADIPVFREVAGDAALYADPYDPAALASAMEAVLVSAEARRMLVKRGRERLAQFTWQRTASKLLGLFEEVLAERLRAA